MLNLKEADITQTRFYQEVFQIGHQEGQQIGRQEGQQIGHQEGELEIVLRLLKRLCGQLSIAQQAQIKSLPISEIENLGEALLDFKGMADLEVWLDGMAKV